MQISMSNQSLIFDIYFDIIDMVINLVLKYITNKEDIGTKLKYILKSKMYISNILLNKLKLNNSILVNNEEKFVNYIVKENDEITISIPNNDKKFSNKFKITNKELNILYEDEYLLIIDKESNTPIHPSSDNYTNTLSNYVAYYLENKGINGIHILTRLDKNTSGICIFAKNEYIQELFIRKKYDIKLQKEYLCIVNGIVEKEHDVIEAPIARKENTIILREVNESGDYAKTEYFTLNRNYDKNYSVIKILLHTGRTHQIRVHMSYLGHTLLGDDLYAKDNEKEFIKKYITRHALHCKKISFYHPITNRYIEIESNIPNDILTIYNENK